MTDVTKAYDARWYDCGKPIKQTSFIVDSPDGKILPMTEQGRIRYAEWMVSLGRIANPTGVEGCG